ncbi:MAG: 2,4-dihydroxyhept-2-ene-1,7-dioic acid aldolase [Thalassospira sp. Nap_22]|nr:MAG: 2,4-dihydroxyhept-2-ene-1,7-dioic acid aldolase [Thalassospira sp. Nap_22]
MFTTKGSVKTDKAAKYLVQLCKHFAHKVEVDLGETTGNVAFPMGPCVITAHEDRLTFDGQSHKSEGIESMKGVIIIHLDKFAWREAPLEYHWEDGETPDA